MEDSPRDTGRSGKERLDNTVTLVPTLSSNHSLIKQQTEALSVIAESFSAIAQSLSSLPRVIDQAVNTLVKGQGVNAILGGLAQHDGRKALDARTMKQNALEIVEQMELVFKKYNERMREAYRSATIVDAEQDFNLQNQSRCPSDTQQSSQEASSQEQELQDPIKPS